ncbi:MAG: sigma 54-interacting transcriptional regulator [Firmicutes bacterium]|nr:sigma 54-interacting transcriptional regulator [Bacillota bacterium]
MELNSSSTKEIKIPVRPPRRYGVNQVTEKQIVAEKGPLEEKAVLEALRKENKWLTSYVKEMDTIFHSCYDGIGVIGRDGTILRVNKAFERLTGLKIEKVQGKNLYDTVKVDRTINSAIALRVLETGQPSTILQQCSTGKELMVTGNPVFDDQGRVARVVLNLRDVTDVRRLQEELRQTQELNAQYRSELEDLKKKYTGEKDLVYKSSSMKNIFDLACRVAGVEAPVLLLGESGVGKEIIATLLHNRHPDRSAHPFIKVNCGAIPAELMESEFFGYEPGAFTGAGVKGKPGFFEMAHRGTIFLDEIAELPQGLQVKLLRVLQERELTRLGGTRPVKVDFRVIAATNKDLEKMVRDGSFREDLFYRINVIPIKIPPLRERKEDIAALLFHYLDVFNKKYGMEKRMSGNVVDCLKNYSWPGNVRELVNLVERLVVTTENRQVLLEHLPLRYRIEKIARLQKLGEVKLQQALDELEKCLVAQALETHKSTYKAAGALGVSQSTVVRLAKKHGLNKKLDFQGVGLPGGDLEMTQ